MLAKHPDPIVAHVLETWAPRMIVQGIDYNDLMTTGARIGTWDDWCREWYAKAAPYLSPPAARYEVPFENFRMAAYLRIPAENKKPPVVVIISGLESTKEEARTMEDGFLRRGMATFTFDGPRQGESWFQGGMIVEFERATSAVIDYIEKLPELDPERVGVFGPSMGGYLAPRSAACGVRTKASTFAGGMYDPSRVSSLQEDPFESARLSHIW